MAKLDPKFTESMVAWLNSEHNTAENVMQGATLLLQLNRNKGLFMRISRNPLRCTDKVVYELKKHLNYRLQGYTIDDIVNLDKEITPQIEVADMETTKVLELNKVENAPTGDEDVIPIIKTDGAVAVANGKRPDHDHLPEDIQAIWPQNAERWKKIKATFELLKTLNAPCDRFEHLKVLKESWYKYREEMNRYDDYKSGDETPQDNGGHQLSELEQNEVDNAQSYISRNLPVLKELAMESREPDFSEESAQKLEDLRLRISNRVKTLLKYHVDISEERLQELESVDIATKLPEENAEG